MFITAFIIFVTLLIIAMIIYANRPHVIVADPLDVDLQDDVTTTTATTTVTTTTDIGAPAVADEPEYEIVGDLKRSKARNGQFFVKDPADKAKIFVNETDDLYRDAEGKIWRLV